MIEIAWKIYFWLLLSFTLIALGFDFHGIFYDRIPEATDIFITVLSLIGIIGVFGYVYKRAIYNARFWKLIFYINALILFFSTYLIFAVYSDEPPPSLEEALLLLLMLIIAAPELIALYLYSFKSKNLWQ